MATELQHRIELLLKVTRLEIENKRLRELTDKQQEILDQAINELNEQHALNSTLVQDLLRADSGGHDVTITG